MLKLFFHSLKKAMRMSLSWIGTVRNTQGVVAIERALFRKTPTIDLNSLSLTFIEDSIIVASFKVTAFWIILM